MKFQYTTLSITFRYKLYFKVQNKTSLIKKELGALSSSSRTPLEFPFNIIYAIAIHAHLNTAVPNFVT